jgi:hypothetical protein
MTPPVSREKNRREKKPGAIGEKGGPSALDLEALPKQATKP